MYSYPLQSVPTFFDYSPYLVPIVNNNIYMIQNNDIFPELKDKLKPLVDQIIYIITPYINNNFNNVEEQVNVYIQKEIYKYTNSNMITNMIMKTIKPMVNNMLKKYKTN